MVDGNVTRKMKRGKKQSSGGSDSLPRSKSFPSSHGNNAYDGDYESDPEADQAAASQHVSIQVVLSSYP